MDHICSINYSFNTIIFQNNLYNFQYA